MKMKTLSRSFRRDLVTYGMVVVMFLAIQLLSGMGMLTNSLSGQLVPICAYIIMAISLNLTVGILGELSLGHAGFMSVGGFVGAFVSVCVGDAVPSMANYLAPLNATALVTQSGADLVAYGLDEPSNRIEVATDAGETCTVLVGAQNTHTGEYYIKLEGEEPVYTVSESFAAAFTRTERGLQQTENWPVESTDSVTRATLEQGSNTLTVDVSEDADGNKTYTASDTARTETPDTAAAQAFISSAATLYFSSSADFKPTDEALAAYGLAEPSATLTVEWTRTDDASGAQESVTSVLYLGAVDANGDYYARLADSNAVSTLNATALSGVLGMTLDGMLPAEEESAPESAPASESGSVSAASAAD